MHLSLFLTADATPSTASLSCHRARREGLYPQTVSQNKPFFQVPFISCFRLSEKDKETIKWLEMISNRQHTFEDRTEVTHPTW